MDLERTPSGRGTRLASKTESQGNTEIGEQLRAIAAVRGKPDWVTVRRPMPPNPTQALSS